MMYTDCSRGRPMAKDPCVVRFLGKYFLYYSIPPWAEDPNGSWCIGIAASTDMEQWEKVGEIEREGHAEGKGICAPAAFVQGDTLHLFYQTYGGFERDSICHARSRDGIHFVRNMTNPILRAKGKWNCGRAIDADAVVFQNALYLYFATRDPEKKIQMLAAARCPLDGEFLRENWEMLGDGPILKPELTWEQNCIEAPAALAKEEGIFLFYAGAYNNSPQQIGVAFSRDGAHFERLNGEPFLRNGRAGSWNESESGHPYVFEDEDGRVFLFYQGNRTMGSTWYLSKVEIIFRNGLPSISEEIESRISP